MPPKKGKAKEKNGEGSKRTPEERPNTTSANENLQVNDITFENERYVTKNMITKIRKNQR